MFSKNRLIRSVLGLVLIAGALCLSSPSMAASKDGLQEARSILIQHNGRIKPLEAFSRSAVKLFTGKESWQKRPALDAILTLLADLGSLDTRVWVRIDHLELIKYLGLPEDRHYFSWKELEPHLATVQKLVKSSQDKRNSDLRPSKLEQRSELLYTQMITLQRLRAGELINVIPTSRGAWLSPYGDAQNTAEHGKLASDFKKMAALYGKDGFRTAAKDWRDRIATATHDIHTGQAKAEVLYYETKPFHYAWVFYLLAGLLIATWRQGILRKVGTACFWAAFFFHTAGIVLRVYILSRPPVSNMYESMIFMNWALVGSAILFYATKRLPAILSVGAVLSALVMIYADLLPIDSGLDVLVPVLRSNYWLTIHVMTIVSSYGVFGLAMGLGHRHLWMDISGKLNEKSSEDSANLIYRIMQIGILLIGIGTVLGGVWANESWGRFWGWDPKETWALITFLGYIAIVHLRYTKWLNTFRFAVLPIIGFQLVLMTWYGVNFVLGRGLHSYGSGSGGMNWVIYYLVLETLFLIYVGIRKAGLKSR